MLLHVKLRMSWFFAYLIGLFTYSFVKTSQFYAALKQHAQCDVGPTQDEDAGQQNAAASGRIVYS